MRQLTEMQLTGQTYWYVTEGGRFVALNLFDIRERLVFSDEQIAHIRNTGLAISAADSNAEVARRRAIHSTLSILDREAIARQIKAVLSDLANEQGVTITMSKVSTNGLLEHSFHVRTFGMSSLVVFYYHMIMVTYNIVAYGRVIEAGVFSADERRDWEARYELTAQFFAEAQRRLIACSGLVVPI